jgi:hypothetical protein
MAVLKEWACIIHGPFESTHAICPGEGCDSSAVVREFRSAPAFKSDYTKRTDAGIRRSADMYRINNFRSAKEGEAAYGGDKAKAMGTEIIWGTGPQFQKMMAGAGQPLTVHDRGGAAHTLTENNAMREAAREAGITRRKLAQAGEVTGDKDTTKAAAQALTV